MSHNISEFLAQIKQFGGFMRPNQFQLSIPGMPKWATSKYDSRSISFACNSANLPGVNVDSIDVRKYGQGFLENFPTGVSFFDLNTTFYADAKGELVKFFREWAQNIVDFDPDNKEEKFRVHYRDNYLSQIQIVQFNEHKDKILTFNYIDAFPVLIQPIGVRWFSRDEITEFEVVWKYRAWKLVENGDANSAPFNLATTPTAKNNLPGLISPT